MANSGMLRVSPVALLELDKLERDARRDAAELPMYAPLTAAVACGGVSRAVGADGVCVYGLPGAPDVLDGVLAAVGALPSIADYDPYAPSVILGAPLPRPALRTLALAAAAVADLRAALVACAAAVAAVDAGGAARPQAEYERARDVLDRGREAHKAALGWVYRLPPANAEEVDCARTYLADALAIVDLRQSMAWCDEDGETVWRDDAPPGVRDHPAFAIARTDAAMRCALRASGPRLDLSFLRYRVGYDDFPPSGRAQLLAALCRKYAALCRACARCDWERVSDVARAPADAAYPDPTPGAAPPRGAAGGCAVADRDMDGADWSESWAFLAPDVKKKCARAERRMRLALYDRALADRAALAEPDDAPLRRLEGVADGDRINAAVEERRVTCCCVVAMRNAVARGEWEKPDDPANASVAEVLRVLREVTPEPFGAACRDVAPLRGEISAAEDALARRAGLRAMASRRAAVAIRTRGVGEAFLPGVPGANGEATRTWGTAEARDRWWDVGSFPDAEAVGLGLDAPAAAEKLAEALGDPRLRRLAARERCLVACRVAYGRGDERLLRYARDEFRRRASADGGGGGAGDAAVRLSQSRELGTVSAELAFLECVGAWRSATVGDGHERDRWLAGPAADGDPAALDFSKVATDGLERLRALLESDDLANAQWADADGAAGAARPPRRRLQRLRVACRVLFALRTAARAAARGASSGRGAAAEARAAVVAATRTALAALRDEGAEDDGRYAFLGRGAGPEICYVAQWCVETEARRLVGPVLARACVSGEGAVHLRGGALRDLAAELAAAEEAARSALGDVSLGPWRTRGTLRLLLSARTLARLLAETADKEDACAPLTARSGAPILPEDGLPPRASARDEDELASPPPDGGGGGEGEGRAPPPTRILPEGASSSPFPDDDDEVPEASMVPAAYEAYAVLARRCELAESLDLLRRACSTRRGVAGRATAAVADRAAVGAVGAAVARVSEDAEALAAVAPGGDLGAINAYEAAKIADAVACASYLRLLRAAVVAAHRAREGARTAGDHAGALAAAVAALAAFRAGDVGDPGDGGTCPVRARAGAPPRPPWSALAGAAGDGGPFAINAAAAVTVRARFSPGAAAATEVPLARVRSLCREVRFIEAHVGFLESTLELQSALRAGAPSPAYGASEEDARGGVPRLRAAVDRVLGRHSPDPAVAAACYLGECVLRLRERARRGEWEFRDVAAADGASAAAALAYAPPPAGERCGDLCLGDTSVRGLLERLAAWAAAGRDAEAESCFSGDVSRAVDYGDALAVCGEVPVGVEEVAPAGALRCARGAPEVVAEVRFYRVALEDRRVRATLLAALADDRGVEPRVLARCVAAAARAPTSASAIAGAHGAPVSPDDSAALFGDGAGGGDERLRRLASTSVALAGAWYWAPRRYVAGASLGAGPHAAQLSPRTRSLLEECRLLVAARLPGPENRGTRASLRLERLRDPTLERKASALPRPRREAIGRPKASPKRAEADRERGASRGERRSPVNK